MIQAVLDVNVIISGLIRRDGPPGQLLARWDEGEFELVVSAILENELRRVPAFPKFEKRLPVGESARFLKSLATDAVRADDPVEPAPVRSEDPNDDYLIGLTLKTDALLVSGDRHLTDLRGTIPVCTPAEFLDYLAAA